MSSSSSTPEESQVCDIGDIFARSDTVVTAEVTEASLPSDQHDATWQSTFRVQDAAIAIGDVALGPSNLQDRDVTVLDIRAQTPDASGIPIEFFDVDATTLVGREPLTLLLQHMELEDGVTLRLVAALDRTEPPSFVGPCSVELNRDFALVAESTGLSRRELLIAWSSAQPDATTGIGRGPPSSGDRDDSNWRSRRSQRDAGKR